MGPLVVKTRFKATIFFQFKITTSSSPHQIFNLISSLILPLILSLLTIADGNTKQQQKASYNQICNYPQCVEKTDPSHPENKASLSQSVIITKRHNHKAS